MNEEWRPVSVRPDRYEVSNLGRVRSSFKNGLVRVLKPFVRYDGYHRYAFKIDGKNRYFYAHRLVAEAFLEFTGDPYVRHLDGNPSNNRATNISYGTASENNFDTVRHGNNWQRNKTHCDHGHAFNVENTHYDRFGRRACRKCACARSARYAKRLTALR